MPQCSRSWTRSILGPPITARTSVASWNTGSDRVVTIKDYPQVQGVVLFFAAVLVTINLLVDLSYAWFDPRIRYS